MCQYLLKIVEGGNDRAIFRCEHGAFHLVWDSGTLHFFPDELTTLNMLFGNTAGGRVQSSRLIQLLHPTARNGATCHELWVEDMGIRLSAQDYHALKNLLREAALWLSQQPPFDKRQHIHAAKMFSRFPNLPARNEPFLLN